MTFLSWLHLSGLELFIHCEKVFENQEYKPSFNIYIWLRNETTQFCLVLSILEGLQTSTFLKWKLRKLRSIHFQGTKRRMVQKNKDGIHVNCTWNICKIRDRTVILFLFPLDAKLPFAVSTQPAWLYVKSMCEVRRSNTGLKCGIRVEE